MVVTMNRGKILDYKAIRQNLRELIKSTKKSSNPNEIIKQTLFLREVQREVTSYLISSNYIRKEPNERYKNVRKRIQRDKAS